MSLKADVARTKVEIDVENHLLGTTVKLSDGSNGKVFSRSARNDANVFLYNCHLCSIPNLPGERCLQTHIAGRKHQTRLALPVVDADSFRQPLQQKNKIQMNIAPGEPVPPGFENEVKPMAEIQKTLDVYKEQPLVALEYLSELSMGQNKEPTYHCILCDKKGDPRTIVAHLTSKSHRQLFLEKHFPSVIKEIQPYRFPAKAHGVLGQLFQTVCEAIEDYHGRLTPNVHDNNEYTRNRTKYQQAQIFEKHIDESMGLKFTEVIDRKLIADTFSKFGVRKGHEDEKRSPSPLPEKATSSKRFRSDHDDDVMFVKRGERNSLDSISSISSGSVVAISPSRSRSPSPRRRVPFGGNNRYRRSRSRSRSPINRHQRPIDSGRSTIARRPSPGRKITIKPMNDKKIPTPKELSAQASEIAHERYKWEKYRCMVDLAIVELEKVFKEREKNPEKHPLYPEEWKNFWNRRYKELQSEKKDPAKHDFKPEWIDFWTRRMKDLHSEEVAAKKLEIRKKMNLPDRERTDELKEAYLMKPKKKERSPAFISDDDDENGGRNMETPSNRRRPERTTRSRSRSRRSLSDDRSRSRDRDRDRDGRRYDDHYSGDRSYYNKQYPPMHPAYQYSGPPRVPQVAPPYDDYRGPYNSYPGSNYPPGGDGNMQPEPEEDEGPLTFVAVCRLLIALEEQLGSLGPKVIDLMSKALALEKVKANSADDMLINEDNCVFFETVKEKLKGQLQANVLHYSKVPAVKRAVKNIAALIHQVTEKNKDKKKPETSTEADKVVTPTTSKAAVTALAPTVNVEKVAMAQKIAAALVAQGKTDVTPEQLEQLISFYTKMSEAAKKKEQPISTAAFLNDIERKETPTTSGATVKTPEAKKKTPTKSMAEDKDEMSTSDAANALESLTDSDLQTLLQNFKDLSTDEQHHLIAYLKKLESTDPVRVEKLRKYVNVGGGVAGESVKQDSPGRFSDREDDFEEDTQPIVVRGRKPLVSRQYDDEEDERNKSPPIKHAKIFESEDEDDYDFDDVVKTASKNVQSSMATVVSNTTPLSMSGILRPQSSSSLQRTITPMKDDDISNMSKDSAVGSTSTTAPSLSDTQNLIANLMGSLQKSVSRIGPVTSSDTQTTTSANLGRIDPFNQQQSSKQSQPSSQHTAMMQSQGMNNVPFYYQQQQQQQFNQQQQSGFNQYPNQQNFSENNQSFGNYGMQQNSSGQFQQQQQQQQRPPQGYGGANVGYPQQNNMNNNYPRNNNFNNYY